MKLSAANLNQKIEFAKYFSENLKKLLQLYKNGAAFMRNFYIIICGNVQVFAESGANVCTFGEKFVPLR
ncbi:MAG: hypothetical protein ACI4AM_07380 [Muribaculaceae bacterium]